MSWSSIRRRSRITRRYEQPHQYATGMTHVWVNGVQVLKDGEHTGAKPGRVVRGPGWKGKAAGTKLGTKNEERRTKNEERRTKN